MSFPPKENFLDETLFLISNLVSENSLFSLCRSQPRSNCKRLSQACLYVCTYTYIVLYNNQGSCTLSRLYDTFSAAWQSWDDNQSWDCASHTQSQIMCLDLKRCTWRCSSTIWALRARENDWMWVQKLKSRQEKAELSIAPQSNTTPTVTLVKTIV